MPDFLQGLQDNAKAAEEERRREEERARRELEMLATYWRGLPERVAARSGQQAAEYRAETVHAHAEDVGLVLNDRAADGWALRVAVPTVVKSPLIAEPIDGLMLIFERPGPAG